MRHRLMLLGIFVATIWATTTHAQCTIGGNATFGANEYVVCTNTANYNSARNRCQSIGTGWDSVSIESAAENTAITPLAAGGNAWIGARDQVEGAWFWDATSIQFWSGNATGSAVGGNYENWNGGEPNNSGNEDCAEMYASGNWNDNRCNRQRRFICEGPAACGNGIVSTGEGCDDGNLTNGDGCSSSCAVEPGFVCTGSPSVCTAPCGGSGTLRSPAPGATTTYFDEEYFVCDQEQTRTAAFDTCAAVGGRLIEINSTEENSFIRTLTAGDIWLGASDSLVEGVWRWDSGPQFWQGLSSGTAVGGLYNNWQSGEPNDYPPLGGEDCAEMWQGGLFWNDIPCNQTNRVVCELAPECGNGVLGLPENCDDGNTTPGDGCDASCNVELGFECEIPDGSGVPSVCSAPAFVAEVEVWRERDSVCVHASGVLGVTAIEYQQGDATRTHLVADGSEVMFCEPSRGGSASVFEVFADGRRAAIWNGTPAPRAPPRTDARNAPDAIRMVQELELVTGDARFQVDPRHLPILIPSAEFDHLETKSPGVSCAGHAWRTWQSSRGLFAMPARRIRRNEAIRCRITTTSASEGIINPPTDDLPAEGPLRVRARLHFEHDETALLSGAFDLGDDVNVWKGISSLSESTRRIAVELSAAPGEQTVEWKATWKPAWGALTETLANIDVTVTGNAYDAELQADGSLTWESEALDSETAELEFRLPATSDAHVAFLDSVEASSVFDLRTPISINNATIVEDGTWVASEGGAVCGNRLTEFAGQPTHFVAGEVCSFFDSPQTIALRQALPLELPADHAEWIIATDETIGPIAEHAANIEWATAMTWQALVDAAPDHVAIPDVLAWHLDQADSAPEMIWLVGSGTYHALSPTPQTDTGIPTLLEHHRFGYEARDQRLLKTYSSRIALGRLPVVNAAAVTKYLARAAGFKLDSAPAVFKQGDQRHYQSIRGDISLPIREADVSGTAWLHYVGHGGINSWGKPSVVEQRTFETWIWPSMMSTSTCLSGRFELSGITSVAEALLQNEHGPAVFIAPYGGEGEHEAERVLDALRRLRTQPGASLGSKWLRLQRDVPALANHGFFGDPALGFSPPSKEMMPTEAESHNDAGIKSTAANMTRGGACSVHLTKRSSQNMWFALAAFFLLSCRTRRRSRR